MENRVTLIAFIGLRPIYKIKRRVKGLLEYTVISASINKMKFDTRLQIILSSPFITSTTKKEKVS